MASPLKTLPFDPADYLAGPEDQAELLSDALATGDAAYVANALGTIARARGRSDVARVAGVTREALYKALRPNAQPRFETVSRVCAALGVKLVAQPAGR